MFSILTSIYTAFSPPVVEKNPDAIKFGILGAAKIAPMALLTPAKSHPEVTIRAISARDRARAEAFAKQHGIPVVRDTYQEILDDPDIDAIFIPLPNSLHFKWALRSLRAGKHVLLEKPSVNTSLEASLLFTSPALSIPNAPILLEAFHNRFHPAVHHFLSFIHGHGDVEHVWTDSMVPALMTAKENIEFNYSLGGGSMMMLGTYNFGMLRMIFGDEPVECEGVETSVWGDGVHDKCDTAFHATFRFPNGGIGEATTTIRGSIWWKPSEARVTLKDVVVEDKTLPSTQEKIKKRMVTLHGFMQAFIWHRIDVVDTFVLRNKSDQEPVKKWVEKSSPKAYSWKDVEGSEDVGEDWWNSYRHQLETFVNRVKGRETKYWISGEDSINQMKMLDMAYEKSGLGLRLTSEFR